MITCFFSLSILVNCGEPTTFEDIPAVAGSLSRWCSSLGIGSRSGLVFLSFSAAFGRQQLKMARPVSTLGDVSVPMPGQIGLEDLARGIELMIVPLPVYGHGGSCSLIAVSSFSLLSFPLASAIVIEYWERGHYWACSFVFLAYLLLWSCLDPSISLPSSSQCNRANCISPIWHFLLLSIGRTLFRRWRSVCI